MFPSAIWSVNQRNFPVSHGPQCLDSLVGFGMRRVWLFWFALQLLHSGKNIYHRLMIHLESFRFIEKSWKLHHFMHPHMLNTLAKTWSQVYWKKRGKKWIGWRRKASAQEFGCRGIISFWNATMFKGRYAFHTTEILVFWGVHPCSPVESYDMRIGGCVFITEHQSSCFFCAQRFA